MILTVDIGNTNIVLGGWEGDKLRFVSRMPTDRTRLRDGYAIALRDTLSLYHYTFADFNGAIVSSVVPQLLSVWRKALTYVLSDGKTQPITGKVLTVSPGVKTGLNIRIDNPAQLGSDMVCVSVAALAKYPTPSIVIDLGTATKISAVDRKGNMVGCAIMPGVLIGLEALSSRTAQLPQIDLDGEVRLIGTNTVDSMRSGVILGTASMIDGMADRFREELGQDLTVIATGGLSAEIIPHCRTNILHDQDICLEGLRLIYEKNGGEAPAGTTRTAVGG